MLKFILCPKIIIRCVCCTKQSSKLFTSGCLRVQLRSYVLVPLLASSSTSRSCQFWQLPELPKLATPGTAKVGNSRNCQSWQLPETAKVGNSQKLPKLATPRNCQSWQLPETAKVGNSQKLPKLATPRNCQSWQLPEIASFGIFCNWQMAKRSEQVLFI